MGQLIRLGLAVAALLLAACATTPDPVADAEVEPLTVARAQAEPARFRGTRIRWGGTIVAVSNEPEMTVLEVLSRPLDANAAPDPDALGAGRFRARVAGFLDPSEYSAGRWLTVVGVIGGTERGRVGEHPYAFPVVDVEHFRLWRTRDEISPPPYYYDPWWWDPWYYPWRRYPDGWHHPFWW